MKALIIVAAALALLAPPLARAQHEGHTMPLATATPKKQTTPKAVVKKQATKRGTTPKRTTKARTSKQTVKPAGKAGGTAVKRPASRPAHQGHGGTPTKGPTGKAPTTPKPQSHEGHGQAPATKEPAKKPPVQPGHEGHTNPPVAKPAEPGTPAQPQQHQGHEEKPPVSKPQDPHQGHGTGTQTKPGVPTFPPPETLPIQDKRDWPAPVMDDMTYSFYLFERLEYLPSGGGGNAAWDFLGWTGGDYRRIWIKSEGEQSLLSGGEGEGDLEVHYGRLVRPFWDFLTGVRLDGRWGNGTRGRLSVGAGFQGLAPYVFETEAFVYLSQNGQFSFTGSASRDLYLTQRLAIQPRIEMNAALTPDRAFGIGSGLNDVDVSLRLRYEIRRQFAPYIGVSWRQQFGQTASFSRASGEDASRFRIVAGVRMWF